MKNIFNLDENNIFRKKVFKKQINRVIGKYRLLFYNIKIKYAYIFQEIIVIQENWLNIFFLNFETLIFVSMQNIFVLNKIVIVQCLGYEKLITILISFSIF